MDREKTAVLAAFLGFWSLREEMIQILQEEGLDYLAEKVGQLNLSNDLDPSVTLEEVRELGGRCKLFAANVARSSNDQHLSLHRLLRTLIIRGVLSAEDLDRDDLMKELERYI